MGTYIATSRTNYFRVKDESAFRAWAAEHGFEIVEQSGHFGLLPNELDDSGSFEICDDDGDDCFLEQLASHLEDAEIAVIMEVGHEKSRYLVGVATAVNNAGETIQVCLDDVYEAAAKRFGHKPTKAES